MSNSLTKSVLETQILQLLGDDPESPAIFSMDEIDQIIGKVVLAYSAVCPRKMMTYCSIHREVHRIADPTTEDLADATDDETLLVLLNDLKGLVNDHFAAETYHRAADTTNLIEAEEAINGSTAFDLCNELKADLNAHMIEAGVHMVDDAANRITIADCVDTDTCYLLANQIKAKFNSHLSGETDGRWVYIRDILDAAEVLVPVEDTEMHG